MKLCDVVILAGGFGTRLKERIGEIPKPMTPIFGIPVLEYLVKLCKRNGFQKIALLLHHKSEFIQEYFGDGSRFGVYISYSIETEARGTAGAVIDSINLLDDSFIVLYGDTYADVDLRMIWNDHNESNADATLLLHPNDHPTDSDLVEIDCNKKILKINPYPHSKESLSRNLVNAALYVLKKSVMISYTSNSNKLDFAKNVFPELLQNGKYLKGYITSEYIKDMGTPERLDQVANDILLGLPDKLSNRNLRKCIFMDRDGTLNKEVDYLSSPDQMFLIPGVASAVRKINKSGYLSVCITNQPVIARGEVTFEGLEAIHSKLEKLLGINNAYLDRIYYCPHHPDSGYSGEVSTLKIKCNCRKPGRDLVERAIEELKINRRLSWFVGDTTVDIETGYRSGLHTILVRTGYSGNDRKFNVCPDYIVPNFEAAVDWILEGHTLVSNQLFGLLSSTLKNRYSLIGGPSRAGKSSVAQVLKEIITEAGRNTHVISLDSWLVEKRSRKPGIGVENRYDLSSALSILEPLIKSSDRCEINIPIYDPCSGEKTNTQFISVGPDDFIIIEGVPALLCTSLLDKTGLKIYVDVDDSSRLKRLREEYLWRGLDKEVIDRIISSREIDELPIIRSTIINSNYQIKT